jgi:hypothetical protein
VLSPRPSAKASQERLPARLLQVLMLRLVLLPLLLLLLLLLCTGS